MTEQLGLFPDHTLGLYIDAPLPLHALPTEVDLLTIQVRWDHQTYGGTTFDATRLRPAFVRVRPPASAFPELISLRQLTPTGYETLTHWSSVDFGSVIEKDTWFHYSEVQVVPEIGTLRTPYSRVLPEGGGLLYAHAMERQHVTLYERNADAYWVNQGTLTLGFNAGIVRNPWLRSWYPRLELPQFGYLNGGPEGFPLQAELSGLITAPVPLPTGHWRIEIAHPLVQFNRGAYRERTLPGSVAMELEVHTGQNRPLAQITEAALIRQFRYVFADGLGEGEVPAADLGWNLPLSFEGDN